MNDAELHTVLEELGDCMEDMARSVDRQTRLLKRLFREVQSLVKKGHETETRVQTLEDEKAAQRLERS